MYCPLLRANKIPKNLWPHIVNKEDYIDIINPVLPKEKEFQYLTHDEILEMNDKQRENYFKKKDEQIEYDSELTKIREDNDDINGGSSYIWLAFGQTMVGTNDVPATAR